MGEGLKVWMMKYYKSFRQLAKVLLLVVGSF